MSFPFISLHVHSFLVLSFSFISFPLIQVERSPKSINRQDWSQIEIKWIILLYFLFGCILSFWSFWFSFFASFKNWSISRPRAKAQAKERGIKGRKEKEEKAERKARQNTAKHSKKPSLDTTQCKTVFWATEMICFPHLSMHSYMVYDSECFNFLWPFMRHWQTCTRVSASICVHLIIQESSVLEISRSSMSYGLQWVVPTMWMVCYVPGSQPGPSWPLHWQERLCWHMLTNVGLACWWMNLTWHGCASLWCPMFLMFEVMIRGLEDELDQRLKGKTFSDTRLPPPPPSCSACNDIWWRWQPRRRCFCCCWEWWWWWWSTMCDSTEQASYANWFHGMT